MLRAQRAKVYAWMCEFGAHRAGRFLYKPHLFWWHRRRWLDPFKEAVTEDRILDRRFTLIQFSQLARRLNGHTAECGVYQAVGSFICCKALEGTYQDGACHWAVDSFQGMSAPVAEDGAAWNAGDLSSPIEVTRARLARFPFARVVPGWIPAVLANLPAGPYRLVHFDLDLYEPTRTALEFFYPKMVRGGVMLFDDYGFMSCPGARKAAEEFFADKPEPIVELATGQAVVLKV